MLRWVRLLSIRAKLLWLVAAMLAIPWMGTRYVLEMKAFLLQGQRDALLLMSGGVATILNEQADLFRDESGVPGLVGQEQDLLVYRLQRFIQVDGSEADWDEIALRERRSFTAGNEHVCEMEYDPDDFELTHLMGYRGSWVYALFQVRDDQLRFRQADGALNQGDHLRILLQTPRGILERYLLVATGTGKMSAYLVDEAWQQPLVAQPIEDVIAVLNKDAQGYTVEVRFPRYQFGERARVGFAVVDIDDPPASSEPAAATTLAAQPLVPQNVIATYPLVENHLPGRILLTSPELTQIVRGLNQPNARIWVLDAQQRVRAVVGGLTPPRAVNEPSTEPLSWWGQFKQDLKLSLDRHLSRPNIAFEDFPFDLTHRREDMIASVLEGKPQTAVRRSLDGHVKIVMAGHPIRAGNSTVGAVVVEQSSHAILASQYELLKRIASISLVAFAIVVGMLFVFAWRLTVRIGRLRDTTERAITAEGRVVEDNIPSRVYPKDELGDLGRSISAMLSRLSGYTRYLENLPDTLAHELNNPLNVVSLSLQNLEHEQQVLTNNKYMARAQDGIERLRTILTALTAAANLEEAMQTEARSRLDFAELVQNYLEGVATLYTSHRFSVDVQFKPLWVSGSPDHLAEMLDKLIDNAVEFSPAGSTVAVSLTPEGRNMVLRVANPGAPIPADVRERIFEPMVSLNRKDAKRTHLGLGLYVVRLIAGFHEGSARMDNDLTHRRVAVTVTLPRVFD